jgi:hypothetical protein
LSVLSGVAASVTASTINSGITQATLNGYHVAFLVSGAFMVFASLIAAFVIKGTPRRGSNEQLEYHTELQSTFE